MTDEALWTANEVAGYLKVSRSWVYLHVESGDLPHRRLGGLLRFVPEQLRAYARGETQPRAVGLLEHVQPRGCQ
ncbi:MAG: helix-turn-helix domain-containing protein [Deltaproteobacteria bacterium]|nr:helix-turn-helix domain-containing protein [Deltaproteobacteria bacterium]